MSLAAPAGLAAAALAVPLVVWYVLRSRRPRSTVASTYLWRRTDLSVSAAVPWQRFRPDATFWLVLLALLAGALALARPFVRVPAQLGDHTILVVDASASMLADEGGPTRLELARREADDLVDQLAPGQRVSVVEAASRARVLVSASDDPSTIRDALAAVRPTHGEPDLVDAFTLAAALQRPGESTVIHLLTDGAVPDTAAAAVPEGLLVTAVGEPQPNLAITHLQAVPVGAGASQVFVQIRNFGAQATQARLTLTVGEDDVVERSLRLAPRGTLDEVLEVSGGDGDVLGARIAPTGTDLAGGPSRDALSVDDRAFAVLASPRELEVLLAGPGNVFLEAALGAVPGVQVRTAPAVPADLSGVDLLVVDRVDAPPAPTVPTVYVAPTAWPAGVTVEGGSELPPVTFQAPDHELLADVDLSEVAIATAQRVRAPALSEVAGGPDGPLLLAGRLDAVPVVAVPFDLLASNLPLRTAWPVLVANAVSWLAGPPVTLPVPAGTSTTLTVPAGTGAVAISPPSGDARDLDPARPRVLVDQVGVWRVTYDGQAPTSGAPAALAVNPTAAEGDLARPAPALEPRPEDGGRVAGVAAEGRRSVAPWLLVLVLGALLAESAWSSVLRPRRGGATRGRGPARRPTPVGTP